MSIADVVIVGARPAGAGTALLLARSGHHVVVLDRTAHGSDTLSTHALMRAGVAQLDRWGVLDPILAAGTPPLHRVTFTYGDRPPVVLDLADPLYAPRRTILDAELATAAACAGAEVRHRVHATGLLRDGDGRVTGVTTRGRDGGVDAVHARLVIGADGRRSMVAGRVGATTTTRGSAATAFVYTHVAGLEDRGLEWLYGHGVSAGIVPTNDDQACVFVGLPATRFRRDRHHGLQSLFLRVLGEAAPAVAARVASSRWVAPLRGFPGEPGWLRRPFGLGWALVGDAAAYKDPATAHGITSALRDAELLARAVHEGLQGPRSMAAALAEYEDVRDRLSVPLHRITDAIATNDWTFDELAGHHLDLSTAMRAEVTHLAGLTEVGSVGRYAAA